MQSLGFVLPLLPGMTEVDRTAMTSCWHGERKAAYEDARRRAGITREAVWIQATPNGDVVVVYTEADDLAARSRPSPPRRTPSTGGSGSTCGKCTAWPSRKGSPLPSRSSTSDRKTCDATS